MLSAACVLPALAEAKAQGVGNATLLVGTPTMMGQTVRPFDAVLPGSPLETDPGDAAGICSDEGVLHVGPGSQVTFQEDGATLRGALEQGYVVIYVDPRAGKDVVLETPFGKLTASAQGADAAGWFSVRHEPEQPGIKPAESVFSSVEGAANAVGTAPVTQPHQLQTGQEWRIVQGRVPGPPQTADTRSAAEELRDLLHRGAGDLLRAQTGDDVRLAAAGPDMAVSGLEMTQVVLPDQQLIVDNIDAFLSNEPEFPSPLVIPEPLFDPRIRDPQDYPAGQALTFEAQYYGYPGPPAPQRWLDAQLPVFTGVDRVNVPAFQAEYIDALPNGGFSYIQLVGQNAELATGTTGEAFFVSGGGTDGWALFTPGSAVANPGFQGLAQVVSAGLEAVATGEYLVDLGVTTDSEVGTLGGSGASGSAFVELRNGVLQLADAPPLGYPHLDRAGDTTNLDMSGTEANAQLAALGAGLDPVSFAPGGDRLLFISTEGQDGVARDAQGLTANALNGPITATDLALPDPALPTTDSGIAALGTPLGAGAENTTGIQFVAQGDILAVIHHAGAAATGGDTTSRLGHFTVERHDRYSIIRWAVRENDGSGQLVELEDFNEPGARQWRGEFFEFLCREVNRVVRAGAHTACGPAPRVSGTQSAMASGLTKGARVSHRPQNAVLDRSLASAEDGFSSRRLAVKSNPVRSDRVTRIPDGAAVGRGQSSRKR